ncbi:MAG: hypothetical protein IT184_16910 [Acidobacteria bacterium]|nr:hypothetical protein [Acidobacteriota bacterium]
MRRLFFAIVVTLLSLSASGAAVLIVDEPCIGVEQSGRDDGACPPTCVTCGCCAQAAEPLLVHASSSDDVVIATADSLVPHLPQTPVLDILHVPKRLAS